MMKFGPSTYVACLLVLLAYLEHARLTDPNQAGPSRTHNDFQPGSSTDTIPGATEWLRLYKSIFSRLTEPASAISREVVQASIQRMTDVENGQDFKIARQCIQNDLSRGIARQMAQSRECLQDIDRFYEALQEIAQIDATRRAQGLAKEGQSVIQQLANLSRLDDLDLCEIESLIRVRDLMVFYQQWPNLHRYILSRLDKLREYCLTIFASIISGDIDQLRSNQLIFQLLENIQLRLGQGYNQQPPPFVHIPKLSPDVLYQAVESEIGPLNHHDPSIAAYLNRQREMVREFRGKCRLIVSTDVVSYYNQLLCHLGFVRLLPTTVKYLSASSRHLAKFEICNMILDQQFPISRVLGEIDHVDQDEAQMVVARSDQARHEPGQEHDQGKVASQTVNQELGYWDPTMTLLGSPWFENEEDFYASLASEVADNYQQDSGIGPSGSLNSEHDH